MTNPGDWEELGAFNADEFDRLGAFVNNAAIATGGKVEQTPLSEYRRVD